MKKFIFISSAKTHKNMIERFYLDVLYDKGIDIEYWDLRTIFYDDNDVYQFPFILKIKSYDYFKKKLSELDMHRVILNIQLSYEFKYLKIFFYTRNFTRSFYSIGNFPKWQSNDKVYYLVKIRKFFSRRILEKLIEIFFKDIFLKDLDICFYSGECSKRIIKAKRYLPINYIDYEKQRNAKNIIFDFKYVVFLDQNLHKHPDFKENRLEYVSENIYLEQLKKLFKSINDKFNTKVLIALHPTSNFYSFYPEELQFKNMLYELLSNCEFVIGHFSTSIYAAISASKPVLLATSKEMEEKYYYVVPIMQGMSSLLKLEIINLDMLNDNFDIPEIDLKKYDCFLNNYCTDKKIKEQFAEKYLIKYFKEL